MSVSFNNIYIYLIKANSTLDTFKNRAQGNIDKLLEELSQTSKELSEYKIKISSLEEEKVLLNQQIAIIKNRHGLIKDAYEELLIEQFETMRNSFIKKLENVNSELVTIRSNYKKSSLYIEEELKQEKQIKELFLKQFSELQKLIN